MILLSFCTGCQGDIRGGTSRGRLLGPSGQTIRVLQQESHCKMQIKGRGSIKLREGYVLAVRCPSAPCRHRWGGCVGLLAGWWSCICRCG